jgi:HD domain
MPSTSISTPAVTSAMTGCMCGGTPGVACTASNAKSSTVVGVIIPDSKLAREITELVRDTEPPLLFHHSSRVYYWGALTGKRRGLRFDPELLYAGAMFHDMGLTPKHASAHERFEVDSANAARDFLRSHGIAEREIETVWTAIALRWTFTVTSSRPLQARWLHRSDCAVHRVS